MAFTKNVLLVTLITIFIPVRISSITYLFFKVVIFVILCSWIFTINCPKEQIQPSLHYPDSEPNSFCSFSLIVACLVEK
jgi:hypothetical protein